MMAVGATEFSAEMVCRKWARARGGVPFSVAECFEAVPVFDDINEVGRALDRLYRLGWLARRTGDGAYVWRLFASAPDYQIWGPL